MIATLDEYVVFGTVAARPESRLPTPSAATAPCTTRKSVARGVRRETRWMATLSPMVSMAPIRVTNTKPGSRDQKATPKWRSNPGQAPAGSPTQPASVTLCVS